ncbi:glycosyltransferase family 39 protein [Rickettsiales endosymbiont of Peranema trichophorum]|uniref:ArnT family glycosyltransferase n=1 Tax=Rickettsiales endosymbiont of Peranema trichophorum TaxID=2486577 RepID=UPI001023E719|nr:glycosyltransferase family 39 protein [Rickettsiales endosymbiont of Peranema trichophorum]RZI47584.1 glycosyltransferase family 39 protein [Rickettsiales endosymbiont of Peranema trichophorum]
MVVWSARQFSFFAVSFFLLLVRLCWLKFNGLELYVDEAQYWVWSKHLDFGYHSKPPFVAWVIACSTYLFGDGEFGVRFFSPVLHFCTGYVVYLSAKEFDKERAYLAGLLYVTMPAVFLSSAVISTDPILLLFWSLAFYYFVMALKTEGLIHWVACGIFCGCGLLTKYNMIFFVASAFLYLLMHKRELLKASWGPYIATFLAFIIFCPNILWNLHHNWVSASHTLELASGYNKHFTISSMLEFLLGQFFVFGPLVFLYLLVIIYKFLCIRHQERNGHDTVHNEAILVYFLLPILLAMLVLAFVSRAYANWAAPCYITACILVATLSVKQWKKYVKISVVLHVLIGISIMLHQEVLERFDCTIHHRYDIFERLRGGRSIAQEALLMHDQYPKALIVAESRKDMALLSYYTRGVDLKLFKWNPSGVINDYFAETTNLNHFKSHDLVIISASQVTPKVFEKYGDDVRFLFCFGLHHQNLKRCIFYMENFHGY